MNWFQLQRWFIQTWPFRVLAWFRSLGVPESKGFGKFKTPRDNE